MPPPADRRLAEQIDYYRARADEYDDWWQRRGRYDRGTEATAWWRAEVAEVEQARAAFAPRGHVLELASGTGWWTERLARAADRLTCIDASPETIAINRARLAAAGLPPPRYAIADLFDWRPDERYNTIFFSFWLSHVPADRFARFWATLADALAPGGRIFLVDSLPDPTSTAIDHDMPDAEGFQERLLNDGRRFRIVKRCHDPATLTALLATEGWRAAIARTGHYFVYGSAIR